MYIPLYFQCICEYKYQYYLCILRGGPTFPPRRFKLFFFGLPAVVVNCSNRASDIITINFDGPAFIFNRISRRSIVFISMTLLYHTNTNTILYYALVYSIYVCMLFYMLVSILEFMLCFSYIPLVCLGCFIPFYNIISLSSRRGRLSFFILYTLFFFFFETPGRLVGWSRKQQISSLHTHLTFK